MERLFCLGGHMVREHLWSTQIITHQLDVSLFPSIPVGTGEPISAVDDIGYIKRSILDVAREYINDTSVTPTIVSSWLTEGFSAHPLHIDDHHGGSYVCIVWLDGVEDAGGDLELWDPRWWNPRFAGGTYQDSKYVIRFKPGTVIMMPATVWHSVTAYTGAIMRRSLNTIIAVHDTSKVLYQELALDEMYRIAAELGDDSFTGTDQSIYQLLKRVSV